MTDQQLMQRIKTEAGALIYAACHLSDVPPSFLAALIANETGAQFATGGLDAAANAKRFEKGVLASLWEVLLGRKANFGSINAAALTAAVVGKPSSAIVTSLPIDAFTRLDALATSWGLTQIMGYQILGPHRGGGTIETLKTPADSLLFATLLLHDFIRQFKLELETPNVQFASLFTCWNTGSPFGKTFDPNYTANGLARMKLYEALP